MKDIDVYLSMDINDVNIKDIDVYLSMEIDIIDIIIIFAYNTIVFLSQVHIIDGN